MTHVWQEVLALSGTPGFNPFGEFLEFSVLGLCLWIDDLVVCLDWSGCFVSDLFYLAVFPPDFPHTALFSC